MNYHEKKEIRLIGRELRSRKELHSFLRSRGFKSEDDFYFLDRIDQAQPWQAISVMTIDVIRGGAAIYETEEDIKDKTTQWDELKVEYLLASLPRDCIARCAIECECIANAFGLDISLGGEAFTRGGLQTALEQIADKLSVEVDEPGSEALGILIQQKSKGGG